MSCAYTVCCWHTRLAPRCRQSQDLRPCPAAHSPPRPRSAPARRRRLRPANAQVAFTNDTLPRSTAPICPRISSALRSGLSASGESARPARPATVCAAATASIVGPNPAGVASTTCPFRLSRQRRRRSACLGCCGSSAAAALAPPAAAAAGSTSAGTRRSISTRKVRPWMSTIRCREGLRDERVHPAHLRVVQRLRGVVLDGHVGRAVGRAIASSGLVAAGQQHRLGVAHPDLRGPHVARAPAPRVA
jgi:hypothetical protein